MPSNKSRQEAVVTVLTSLEPKVAHASSCPSTRGSTACNCYLLSNNRARAYALDSAGLLLRKLGG